ncbi:MAG TPA: outer membrane protein transport protein [Alphaproteobacteria bacterium]|nr:outer membrane protein transport protein [Alphaproteobacteria bacterium]
MTKRLLGSVASVLAILVAMGSFQEAHAAGFQLFDQSPSGQGEAFAGAAAVHEDASTIFYNPAGMAYLDTYQAIAGVQIISSNFTFQPTHATTGAGTPLMGTSGTGGVTAPLGNFYVMAPLGDDFRAGLGVETPFGLETDYGNTWIGRYYAQRTQLKTYNFNPSVSYKANDWLSAGVGFNVMYADAFFSNAIDFGSIFNPIIGTAPQSQDGQSKLAVSGTGYGFNGGVIIKPLEHTTVGISYRSMVHLDLDGRATFSTTPTISQTLALLQALHNPVGNAFQSTGVRSTLNLPESASLAATQQLTDKWLLLGDVTWTHWSRFHDLVADFNNPAQPQQATEEDWHDTYRWAGGLNYTATDKAKLRLGIAYDPTPTKTEFRNFRIPDANRFWLSAGYNVELIPDLSLDFAYTHIFVLTDGSVNLVNNPAAPAGNINGTFDSSANIFAVGLKYNF